MTSLKTEGKSCSGIKFKNVAKEHIINNDENSIIREKHQDISIRPTFNGRPPEAAFGADTTILQQEHAVSQSSSSIGVNNDVAIRDIITMLKQ